MWWPSARRTVLKKLMSGERDADAATAEEPALPGSAVLLGDAVVIFDGRIDDEPHPTLGVMGGL